MNLEQKQAWIKEKLAARSEPGPAESQERFAERHYTVAEVATMWQLSMDLTRRLFINEPGVLVIGDEASPGTRRYRTLRIPESVVKRVHRKLSNAQRG